MPSPILILRDIHLTFGGTPLLEGAELALNDGDRICLVGRNGSGKSTLLKIAAGLIEPDRGERVARQGVTVRYLPQEPELERHASVLDYVEAGLVLDDERLRARETLRDLQLDPNADPKTLSGGERRRAALAAVLAAEPDVLLLDEPTNHLDLPSIEWLEARLGEIRSALILISHDRRFLEQLSQATLWLDRGRIRRLEKSFASFEAWRDLLLEQEEAERHKLERRIASETDWLRHGISARRKRNQGRVRALLEMRRQRREERRAAGQAKMEAGSGEISGKLVIEARRIGKAFDGLTVIRDLSLRVARGDRLGIIGPNGAGKSTLLQILIGQLSPDSGSIRHGANLELVALDQGRASLDPATPLAEALSGGGDNVQVGQSSKHVMSYMKDFLFAPEQARTPVGVLSGGERGRLMLARALAKPSNLLVLDEPTNDLDLETLDLLQEMLNEYAGTVLLVSHDRDFLDRTVTSVLASEGEGRWIEYAGGYSDMLSQRKTPAPDAKATPPKPARQTPPASETRAPAKRRLSFNQHHALKTLPARIAALQEQIDAGKRILADPALFSADRARFEQAATQLAEAEAALAAAEEQWLELEILREEIERET